MAAGDVLFADGDCTYDLIVVLEGCVDVVEEYGSPDSDVIVTYGRLEFVGEMGLLTGQRVFLTGVAAAPGRVLRIPVEQVRAIRERFPAEAMIIIYGSTEAGPVTTLRSPDVLRKPTSVGRPALNVDVRIVSASGRDAGPG